MKKQEAAYALYEEGYRYEIIASRLSISQNAARVHVCNARKDRGLPKEKLSNRKAKRRLIPLIMANQTCVIWVNGNTPGW